MGGRGLPARPLWPLLNQQLLLWFCRVGAGQGGAFSQPCDRVGLRVPLAQARSGEVCRSGRGGPGTSCSWLLPSSREGAGAGG